MAGAAKVLVLSMLLAARSGAVTGNVTWEARDPLPPGAVIELQLQEIGPADAPARPVGEVRIPAAGFRSPAPFSIPFDRAAIDERREYAVRARITDGEKRLLYLSERRHPVLTRGAGPRADVLVEPVRTGRTR